VQDTDVEAGFPIINRPDVTRRVNDHVSHPGQRAIARRAAVAVEWIAVVNQMGQAYDLRF
jgi:predicted GIY-YIG superfamily endonuclease